LESVATTRYGAGKTSYQDVIKIRIGREKLEGTTGHLEGAAGQSGNRTAVPDEPEAGAFSRLAEIPPRQRTYRCLQLTALYPLALENRQELNRMRAMVGKMERMVEMAETMIQPAFSRIIHSTPTRPLSRWAVPA
jgi:cobalt-zinc-cadmium efflux system outer membrane protein